MNKSSPTHRLCPTYDIKYMERGSVSLQSNYEKLKCTNKTDADPETL